MDAIRTSVHSEKPMAIYQLIRELFKVEEMQVLEVFARKRDEGNKGFTLYKD